MSRRHPSLLPHFRTVTAFLGGVMRGKALTVVLPMSVLFVVLALLANGKVRRDAEGVKTLTTVNVVPGKGDDNNRQPAP